MYYWIYKLKFLAPLHCGQGNGAVSLTNTAMTVRADTVFSALCSEAAAEYGCEGVEKIIDLCRENQLKFSDTFPYADDTLYLPKPVYPLDSDATFDVKNRKEIKSVEWIPASEQYFGYYSKYLHSGEMFPSDNLEKEFVKFGNVPRAAIRNGEENPSPFDIGYCDFKDNCGLYGIIGSESKSGGEWICKVFSILGYSGIGGLVSSGCGRFIFSVIENDNPYAEYLKQSLDKDGEHFLLLTTSLPKDEELTTAVDGGYYHIIRRGGFSNSRYADTVKKQTQYFLGSGSVLKNTFEGDVYTVGENSVHKIYRYAKPLFMGVSL